MDGPIVEIMMMILKLALIFEYLLYIRLCILCFTYSYILKTGISDLFANYI